MGSIPIKNKIIVKFYCVSRLSQIEICILFIFHFMLRIRFERKCFFLYSNFRSTTQLYKYMKDFLGGVRGGSCPLSTPPGSAPATWSMKCHILSQDQPRGGLDQRYLYNKMTRLGVWLVFFICASFNIERFIYFFKK